MLTRRGFVNCAICAAATGFAAISVGAEAQSPGLTRTVLSSEDLPGGQYVVVQMAIEITPGTTVARHTHPGIESSVILEGEGELLVDGKPNRVLKAGDSFEVPAVVPHSLRNGSSAMRLTGTFTIEKGKPLASPA